MNQKLSNITKNIITESELMYLGYDIMEIAEDFAYTATWADLRRFDDDDYDTESGSEPYAYGFHQFTSESQRKILSIIVKFLRLAKDDLPSILEDTNLDITDLGGKLYLSMVGHGSGFFDVSGAEVLDEYAEKVAAIPNHYISLVYLYEDGLIYLE